MTTPRTNRPRRQTAIRPPQARSAAGDNPQSAIVCPPAVKPHVVASPSGRSADRRIMSVWLAGCGGTGALLAGHLARMIAGHRLGAFLIDGDREVNLARQDFLPEDGMNKAGVVRGWRPNPACRSLRWPPWAGSPPAAIATTCPPPRRAQSKWPATS